MGSYRVNRRELLAGVAGLGLLPRSMRAAPAEPDSSMLPAYLIGRLNSQAAKWSAEMARITTPEAAGKRNSFVRAKERELLGAVPIRTPLAARVVKTTEREGYRIENVMYQSRPDFWVTANLYVPTRGKGPFPGIVSPCGHYDPGRFYRDYQLAYRHMVENGLVVLAFDPIGQGERRHYWNPNTKTVEALGNMGSGSGATTEHTMAGHFLELIGENVNEHFVWDGMCGVDYLLTRPEVDPKKIGCAGHSGGGTATMYLSCADERIQVVVIHEGGLSHWWPMALEGARLEPADGEQNLFGAAMYGMDFAELHASIAPRPLLVSVENYNPRFNTAAEDVKKRYTAMGIPERFTTVEAQAPHAWTKKLSIATVDWFSRHFYGNAGPTAAPDYEPEPEEVLRCTPNGSLRYSGYETVFLRTARIARTLPHDPPGNVAGALRPLMKYRPIETPMSIQETAPGHVLISSEAGIVLPAVVQRGDRRGAMPVLFLDEDGSAAAESSGLLAQMAKTGPTVVAADLRGLGASKLESNSRRSGNFVQLFSAESWAAYSAWQLDDSLVGMRVADILRAVDYTLSLEGGRGKVQLVGKGTCALLGLLAAAMDPRIAEVVCHGGLLSYRTMAEADATLQRADVVLRGVLKVLDLPDVAASLADRPLRIIDPVDAMKQPVGIAAAQQVYQRTTEAYARKGASGKFRVLSALGGDLMNAYFHEA